MRYLFRGLIRENGKPVEGHVEAPNPEAGFQTLSDNGIVCESLTPDPKPLNLSREVPAQPEFADAIDSALDSSSMQVSFDALTERYRGKRVWVIDRDKIRSRVSQVVDSALAISHQKAEGSIEARQRVAQALLGLFSDNRNIASERNADSIAGDRAMPGLAAGPAGAAAPRSHAAGPSEPGSGALDTQIVRLEMVIKKAESIMAAMAVAVRRIGSGGGGGGGGRRYVQGPTNEPPNEVLLEIFKTNLELQKHVVLPAAEADDVGALPTDAAAATTGAATSSAEAPAASTPQSGNEQPIS